MHRSRLLRASLPALVLLVVAQPAAVGVPAVEEQVTGTGTATDFYLHSPGGGYATRGGLGDWTFVCSGCELRILLTESDLVRWKGARTEPLAPGAYRIASFAGIISHERLDDGGWLFTIHGAGEVSSIAWTR